MRRRSLKGNEAIVRRFRKAVTKVAPNRTAQSEEMEEGVSRKANAGTLLKRAREASAEAVELLDQARKLG